MDLLKLTVTESGNQYICVMVDYFTKWAEAYPLKRKSAEEVTHCVLDFVYKFGAPQRLLTDQGTEFKNKVRLKSTIYCTLVFIHADLCYLLPCGRLTLTSVRSWGLRGAFAHLTTPKQTDWLKNSTVPFNGKLNVC